MKKSSEERGQASVEYLTIIGFALLILMGLVAFAYNYTIAAKQEGIVATASATVNNIVEAANLVYAQGYPARTTLVIQIPQSVQTASISGRVLDIKVTVKGGTTDVFAIAKANMTGTLPTTQGFYKVLVQAQGDFVNVTQI